MRIHWLSIDMSLLVLPYVTQCLGQLGKLCLANLIFEQWQSPVEELHPKFFEPEQSLFVSDDDLLSRSWVGVDVWCLVFSECQEALQPDECLLFAGDPLAQNSEGSPRRKALIQLILSRSLEQILASLQLLPTGASRSGMFYIQIILHLSWPD